MPLHPPLVASDVSISNWPGAGSAPLATDAEGRGNWEFDMVAALGGACLFGKRRGRRTPAMSAFGRQQRPLRVVSRPSDSPGFRILWPRRG